MITLTSKEGPLIQQKPHARPLRACLQEEAAVDQLGDPASPSALAAQPHLKPSCALPSRLSDSSKPGLGSRYLPRFIYCTLVPEHGSTPTTVHTLESHLVAVHDSGPVAMLSQVAEYSENHHHQPMLRKQMQE